MFTDKIDIFGMHVIIPETTGVARRTDYLQTITSIIVIHILLCFE